VISGAAAPKGAVFFAVTVAAALKNGFRAATGRQAKPQALRRWKEPGIALSDFCHK